MKTKLLRTLMFILVATMIAAVIPMTVSATQLDPPTDDAVANGEASLDIQYTQKAPKIDGVVNSGEYYPIPYSVVKGFYNLQYGDEALPDYNSNEERNAALRLYAEENMDAYACWDGQYFYFAMVADAPVAEYTCPEAANSVLMFRYWCMQFGFAKGDAEGMDRFEVGVGASSDEPGECYAFTDWGTRIFDEFVKGENYCAIWDKTNQKVTYEVKVNIREIIKETPKEGSTMRFLYLLSQSGQGKIDGSDAIQIQCGLGCANEKRADQFLLLNFKGLPEDVTVAEGGEIIDEEEQEGYCGKTDFRKESVYKLIDETNNVNLEWLEENGTHFVRATVTGDDPYFGGAKLPVGLNGDMGKYIAIRYRTSAKDAKYIGVSYLSRFTEDVLTEYELSNDDEMIRDGQWRTIVIDMSTGEFWHEFITNLRLWLCVDTKNNLEGQSVDIMWIKHYQWEPDFSEEDPKDIGSLPVDDETTSVESETAPIADDTTATGADVTTAIGTDAETAADTTSGGTANENGGCCSVIAFPIAAAVLVAGAMIVRKKKED